MPRPMVLATAVPRRKAARKLKLAAQRTASRGDKTRVETTVAMLLAESWKPLRKSKLRATRIVIRTSMRSLFMNSKFQGFEFSKFAQFHVFRSFGSRCLRNRETLKHRNLET